MDEQGSGEILLVDLLFFTKRRVRRSDRTDFLCRFSTVFWARDGCSEPLEELVGEERFVGLQLTQPISFQGELQEN